MLFFLPIFLLALTALAIFWFLWLAPRLKYFWLMAFLGTALALASILFWKARSPFTISLPSWMPSRLFDYAPTWQVDDISWPYAFVLSTIALATILTSVARNENHPAIWAGSLALTALGLLAVSAGDPITLLLIWAGLDLVELALLLRSGTRNGGINPAIRAYGAQTAGLGSIIIAVVLQTAQGLPRTLTPEDNLTGLFLLLGASLRLGILPLHPPYRSET
ncbi:MAG: hypothetical protein N2049_10260, partial [Anaerolineales bacterium]|nr:hypothetical protein [Anaerolineales bacterium]